MDWALVIERSRKRLLAVLAPLFAALGFDPRRADLPRHLYRALLITLRPAESAMRRLIVTAAHGLVMKLGGGGHVIGCLKLEKFSAAAIPGGHWRGGAPP
jgi:hypothetical protein